MQADCIALLGSAGAVDWLAADRPRDWTSLKGQPLWSLLADKDVTHAQSEVGLAVLGNDREMSLYSAADGSPSTHVALDLRRLPSKRYPLLALLRRVDEGVSFLSRRELEIANLLPVSGSKAIAKSLSISASTVETMRQRIAAKARTDGGHSLVTWCALNGDVIRMRLRREPVKGGDS
jgi:DNA-binding CsgD family transcriptional regulator